MSDTVIEVRNLSKKYRLGVVNHGMLYKDLQSWWARLRGKEDPHSVIGHEHKRVENGDFWALDDVSFDVQRGDIVGVIGRNGAGKSTLLKIISRLTTPTTGSIRIRGRVASLLEVGTGFHPELTGRENVFLNGSILGMRRHEIQRKFDEIVAFAGIDDHIDTPVKRYSSGMYVRLAFAIAAHLESELVIVDEILAVGDVEFQKKCLGKLGDVSQNGRTVLFVNHNMTAIRQLCNRVIVLHQGKCIADHVSADLGIHAYLSLTRPKTNHHEAQTYLFKDSMLEIHAFRFVNRDGLEIPGHIANDDSAFVEIEFSLSALDIRFNIGYVLYGSDETPCYWSLSTDSEPIAWPKLRLGRNCLRSELPKNLLNEGTYELRLVASLHFVKYFINPHLADGPALTLKIEGGLSQSPYWYDKRPGVCAPRTLWQSL
ncbi:MAG: ABC transporter ATP-binding protein [Spirochaetota bacterium]